jgi:2-hydroxychromene-2-carboxylate isomerase
MASPDSDHDIEFFWDPVCPFAWITSRWVEKVATQTGYRVDWRFISLRLLNKDKDYATEFPEGYEFGHTAGLRMLRVAAAVRADLGRDRIGPLVTAYGESYWNQVRGSGIAKRLSTPDHAAEVLTAAGLSTDYVEALDDTSWDEEINGETELALSRTGRDVGTPIITFGGTEGVSFFGPVISRVPDDDQVLPLWEAVITLAAFPGFAEMKRSIREVPQLAVLGAPTDRPAEEEWTGGHRTGHLPGDRPGS